MQNIVPFNDPYTLKQTLNLTASHLQQLAATLPDQGATVHSEEAATLLHKMAKIAKQSLRLLESLKRAPEKQKLEKSNFSLKKRKIEENKDLTPLKIASAADQLKREKEEKKADLASLKIEVVAEENGLQLHLFNGKERAFLILMKGILTLTDSPLINDQTIALILQKIPEEQRAAILEINLRHISHLTSKSLPLIFQLCPNSRFGTLPTIRQNLAFHNFTLLTEGEKFFVSQEVLKARSSFFDRLLANGMKEMGEGSAFFPATEYPLQSLKAYLDLMYYIDTLNQLPLQEWISVAEISDSFQSEESCRYILDRINYEISSMAEAIEKNVLSYEQLAPLIAIYHYLEEEETPLKVYREQIEWMREKLLHCFHQYIVCRLCEISPLNKLEFKQALEELSPFIRRLDLSIFASPFINIREQAFELLSPLKNIEELILTNAVIKKEARASFYFSRIIASYFPNLKKLDLQNASFHRRAFKHFTSLKKLEELNLSHCQAIGDRGKLKSNMQDLAQIPHLKFLNLRGCRKITPIGLLALKESALEELEIMASQLGDDPIKMILPQNLKALTLEVTGFIETPFFQALQELKSLQELTVTGNWCYPQAEARQIKLPQIKHLSITFTKREGAHEERIALSNVSFLQWLKMLPQLEYLSLRGFDLKPFSEDILQQIRQMQNLKQVWSDTPENVALLQAAQQAMLNPQSALS